MAKEDINSIANCAIQNTGKEIRIGNNVWHPAEFRVHDEDIVMCSSEILIVPPSALEILGDVQFVHTGVGLNRRQEVLVNGERIYSITGGWNYSIHYIETLDERIVSQEKYGRMLYYRCYEAHTPWKIGKLTKYISDDERAIDLLKQIRYVAKNTELTEQQKNVLARKFGRENQLRTIKAILALNDEDWDYLARLFKKSNVYQDILADYLINQGQLPLTVFKGTNN